MKFEKIGPKERPKRPSWIRQCLGCLPRGGGGSAKGGVYLEEEGGACVKLLPFRNYCWGRLNRTIGNYFERLS